MHVSALYGYLDTSPSLQNVDVKSVNFMDIDALFIRLSQRQGLESVHIDLDPGVALLPLLSGPNALPSPFASLRSCSIMCYPEVALALLPHLNIIEKLQVDIARIPSSVHQPADLTIFEELIAQLSNCLGLRILKIGINSLAVDFPSSVLFPRLPGTALNRLAESCPILEDINLLATEASAIDGSSITSEDFDRFCMSLPRLRRLSLKFQPATAIALQTTALQSLGQHCPELEVLRLKVAFQLPALPVHDTVPQILVSSDECPADASNNNNISPLFPKLTHLALSRPATAIAPAADHFTISASSHSASVVDPIDEENLVHSWASPLLAHFPRLEILEAWGDFSGQDNESLNYFLPTQEILASTWEFLSGIEQDLWENDEESFEEGDSWNSLEDWEKASLINECAFGEEGPLGVDDAYPEVGKLAVHDEESEGMITPGRTLGPDDYFDDTHIHA